MKSILLSILSGLLLILCFPRFDIGYLAWFAMVPLLIAIKGKGLKTAFGICFLAGMISNPGIFYWFKLIKGVGWIEFMSLGIYLSSCYFGLFGLALNLVSKRTKLPLIVTAPVIWVSLEYARSYAGFLEFPWMLMGHSQYLNLPIIQISAFTGVYGISFLIVMVNVAISEVIHNRTKAFKPIVATIIIVGISLLYGFSVITKEQGRDTIKITVIQGNVPQLVKWKPEFKKLNFEKYERLTKEALNNSNTSLVVWTESAVQGRFKYSPFLLSAVSTLVRQTQTHFLIGNTQNPKFSSKDSKNKRLGKKKYDSVSLFSPRGHIEEEYHRIILFPFTQYLPCKDWFPWPSNYISRSRNYSPGNEYTIFNLNGVKFGTTICAENTFPEHFRQFVKNGANFMVNITNEARLGETAAPYQVAVTSVFRAVENRISIARSANTGISCFIGPYGKIVGRVHDRNGKETFVEGYLTKEVPISYERTFYTMFGDVFIYMNLIMTAFMIGLSFVKGKILKHKDTKNDG